MSEVAAASEVAVALYLKDRFPDAEVTVHRAGPVDITVSFGTENEPIGFDVSYMRDSRFAAMRIRDRVYRLHYEISQHRLLTATLVLVAGSPEEAETARAHMARYRIEIPDGVTVLFGALQHSADDAVAEFVAVGTLVSPEAEDAP